MGTVTEIQAAIERLSREQQREVADWLNAFLFNETPEMLAALDEGIRSAQEKGVREHTRGELEQKVRQWATGSR